MPANAVTVPAAAAGRLRGGRPGLLAGAGAVALGVSLLAYLGYALRHPEADWQSPVDLLVYRIGGEIARGLVYVGSPHAAAPLYDWGGGGLQFTYPPFAALVFTGLTLIPAAPMWVVAAVADVAGMLATIWMTLGALGHRRSLARAGVTMLLGAALFWAEPVQRTLWLGQIEIGLMTLIMFDLTRPRRCRWQGAGVGLAAGIKLVPLIFIGYLLVTRRFRQAAVATGVFAATIAAGCWLRPGDSRAWWLGGLFLRGSRTGFVGWDGNQSALAVVTRLAGSQAAAQPYWLPLAVILGAAGLAVAARLDRRGQPVTAILTVALTGLLISPISWDHHWVWIVPGVTLLAHAAWTGRAARYALAGLTAAVTLVFLAWPTSLWGQPDAVGGFGEGLIWIPPSTQPVTYLELGDRPYYAEYHWHGLQLITGNLYVLTGAALFVLAAVIAAGGGQPRHGGPLPRDDASDLAAGASDG